MQFPPFPRSPEPSRVQYVGRTAGRLEGCFPDGRTDGREFLAAWLPRADRPLRDSLPCTAASADGPHPLSPNGSHFYYSSGSLRSESIIWAVAECSRQRTATSYLPSDLPKFHPCVKASVSRPHLHGDVPFSCSPPSVPLCGVGCSCSGLGMLVAVVGCGAEPWTGSGVSSLGSPPSSAAGLLCSLELVA